jgi:hypothetical protein
MDLDNMIISTGLTFIFGSWIYETDDKGKLQGRLMEDREDQEGLTLLTRSTKELAERFSRLAISESTQISPMTEFNSDSGTKSASEANPGSFRSNPGYFLMGLRNIDSSLL